MKNTRTIVAIGALVALVAIGALAGMALAETGPFAPPDAPEALPAVVERDLGPLVAEANGAPIYLGEIQSRVEGIASLHDGLEGSLGEDWPDELLQNIVDDKIVEQQAVEMDIVVTQEELDAHMADLKQYFASEAEFHAWLEEGQMSEQELRERVLLQTLASRVYDEVTSSAQVSRQEALAYYRKHREDYPGIDGTGVPFFAVREAIERDLIKDQQDAIYADWLAQQRDRVKVIVVMEDWWEEIA